MSMSRDIAISRIVWVVCALLTMPGAAFSQAVVVDITPGHATNSFSPFQAMGAGIDRDPLNSVGTLFSQPDLNQMLAAGWKPVSYRLNTELSIQAWHWNPIGQWSDPAGQGYFIGSSNSGGQLTRSFGYNLPHRGVTSNQGSSGGYSRLDDGDLTNYWKSNPYLTSFYTGEADSLHAQWVVVDLGAKRPVDAMKIAWANPYATKYQVQYWTGPDAFNDPANGAWQTFPAGDIKSGAGGTVTIPLVNTPVEAEFVRVLMTASSNTCDTHGVADRRNCMGYAINELYLGKTSGNIFIDYVSHNTGNQTLTYCSSVDPWHRPADIALDDGEQPGFDSVYRSGITRGLPMTVPVAMLYDTPDGAATEIAYIESHGYPISFVELGEEPDGQFVLPEDDAALYVQFAKAIHRVDPNLKLAGPVFQGVNDDIPIWPDSQGKTSWFTRFLNYLRSHGAIGDLNVMSFEHYPFDPCAVTWNSLYQEPGLVNHIVQAWKNDGLPAGVPMAITEYNLAFNTDRYYMDLFSALWQADFVGSFLSAGGSAAYYYQYEPLPMYSGCNSYGTFSMFNVDNNYNIMQPTSSYFSTQMLTSQWADPVDAPHQTYPATANIFDNAGNQLVTAYPLLRPDGEWALLLVNKNQNSAETVTITFENQNGNTSHYFAGAVSVASFGSAEYKWEPDGPDGRANPDGPIVFTTAQGGAGVEYTLPKASINVLRGAVK